MRTANLEVRFWVSTVDTLSCVKDSAGLGETAFAGAGVVTDILYKMNDSV